MAASYTLATLRTAILRAVDHETTGYFQSDWLNQQINNAVEKHHDFLIGIMGREYSLAENHFASVVGQADYELPEDFHKLSLLSGLSDIGWIPVLRYEPHDRVLDQGNAQQASDWLPRYNLSVSSSGVRSLRLDPLPETLFNLRLEYHTQAPVYELDDDVIGIPYPELIVLDVSVRCQHRQRKDAAELIAEKVALKAEIEAQFPPLDRDNPAAVIDLELRPFWGYALKYDASMLPAPDTFDMASIRTPLYQSIPNGGVSTIVQLSSREFQIGDAFTVPENPAYAITSNFSITVNEPCLVLLIYKAVWGASGGQAKLFPVRNGAALAIPAGLEMQVAAGDAPSHSKATVFKASAGDLISLNAIRVNGNASVNLIASLTAVKIGEV